MRGTFKGRPNIVTPVMEERIILVAYQDGSWFDRLMVHWVRRSNHKVEALYRSYLQTVRDVRLAGTEVCCSDQLNARLLGVAERPTAERHWGGVLRRRFYAFQATAAVAAMLVLTLVFLHHRGPSAEQLELEQATLQAKASLALISGIMNGTRDRVHDEVILVQTATPIHQSIYKGTETIKNNL